MKEGAKFAQATKILNDNSTKLIIKSLRNLRVLRALRGELTFAPSAVAALVLLSASPAHADTLEARLAPCLACHGAKGQSANPEVPFRAVAGEAWSEPRFERIGVGRRRRQQNERGDGAEREC